MDLILAEPPVNYRRLTLLDMIWLVAAISLGLAAWMFRADAMFRLYGEYHPVPVGLSDWLALGSILFLGVAWMLTIQAMCSDRFLPLQPGIVACIAVVIASMVGNLDQFTSFRVSNNPAFPLWRAVVSEYLSFAPRLAPFVVGTLASWAVLLLESRWRRASGTLELLRRGIGSLILLTFLLRWIPQCLASLKASGLV